MNGCTPDILDSVYTAADEKQVTVLIGLDLSSTQFVTRHCCSGYRRSSACLELRCYMVTVIPVRT